jgi:hypothetical protein
LSRSARGGSVRTFPHGMRGVDQQINRRDGVVVVSPTGTGKDRQGIPVSMRQHSGGHASTQIRVVDVAPNHIGPVEQRMVHTVVRANQQHRLLVERRRCRQFPDVLQRHGCSVTAYLSWSPVAALRAQMWPTNRQMQLNVTNSMLTFCAAYLTSTRGHLMAAHTLKAKSAPKWHSDPVTEGQTNYIANLIDQCMNWVTEIELLGEAPPIGFDRAAAETMAKTIATKGHASGIIEGLTITKDTLRLAFYGFRASSKPASTAAKHRLVAHLESLRDMSAACVSAGLPVDLIAVDTLITEVEGTTTAGQFDRAKEKYSPLHEAIYNVYAANRDEVSEHMPLRQAEDWRKTWTLEVEQTIEADKCLALIHEAVPTPDGVQSWEWLAEQVAAAWSLADENRLRPLLTEMRRRRTATVARLRAQMAPVMAWCAAAGAYHEQKAADALLEVVEGVPVGPHRLDADLVVQVRAGKGADGAAVKVLRKFLPEKRLFAPLLGEELADIAPLLNVDTLMTGEDRERFARLYGKCLMCGQPLKDDLSVLRGLGPTCHGRLNLKG